MLGVDVDALRICTFILELRLLGLVQFFFLRFGYTWFVFNGVVGVCF